MSFSLFILRKVSISTWSRVRLALFWEQIFPAAEKIRSAGVDVAGMHRRDLARFDSVGKRPSFSLHQLRGSSFFGYWWLCEEHLNFPPHHLDFFVLLGFLLFLTQTVSVRLKQVIQR